MRKHVVEQPSREPDGLQAASALAATWWSLNRENSVEELNRAKDLRFASRLRGALSTLREEYGDESVLLVPIQQAWRKSMLAALESLFRMQRLHHRVMLPQERRSENGGCKQHRSSS